MTSRGLLCAAAALLALVTSACQGGVGSPGLPAPPGGYAPAAPAGGQAAQAVAYTRTRTIEGAVYLMPAENDIPLPAVGGFAVTFVLHAAASPTPAGAGAAAQRVAAAGASPSVLASGLSSAAPLAAASAEALRPVAGQSPAPGSSAPPGGTGASGAVPSTSPSPAGSPRHPTPMPSGPKIETKTTIFPSDAPVAPSPAPTGNVQTFTHQTALVRGYVLPATDIALSSLDAVRFTIPKEEQTPNRSFTVALFDVSKKHKERLVAFSSNTSLSGGIVATTGEDEALKLNRGTGYAVVLYGDELPQTPPPTAPPVIPPGTNPYASPPPAYPPGYAPPGYQPQQPTYPPGYPTPTPYYVGPH